MSIRTLTAAALVAGALALPALAGADCSDSHKSATVAKAEPDTKIVAPVPSLTETRDSKDLQAKATVETATPSTQAEPKVR